MSLGMTDTKLLSVIGDDEAGRAIVQSLGSAATTIRTSTDIGTARYTAVVNHKGDCCFGIGEMEAFTKIDYQLLEKNADVLKTSSLLVVDGNLTFDAMKFALDIAVKNQIPVWYEPTDLHKALTIFESGSQWEKVLYFVSPNVNELIAIAKYFQIPVMLNKSKVDFKIIKQITEHLVKKIPVVIATLGAEGLLITRKSSENEPFLDKNNTLIATKEIHSRLYPPLKCNGEVVSVSGCGDCLAAGIITGILRGWKESSCVSLGLHAAKESLISYETVPTTLISLPVNEDFYSS